MAILMEVVNAELPNGATQGTTVDVTHPGFGTPKAVVITAVYGAATGTVYGNGSLSKGFIDSANGQFCHGIGVQDSVATSNTSRAQSLTRVVIVPYAGGGIQASWSGSSITDGIRFTAQGTQATALRVSVLLIGGSDVLNTRVMTNYCTSTSVSYGLGFQA